MSFSAATCLTNTGTEVLEDPIFIYSDKTNFILPFTSATLSELTNCPYIVKGIPPGTKTLRLISNNNYCVDIDIQCDKICEICDLNFKEYFSPSLIPARISAGDLSGSCQTNINDYIVYWYGPNSNNNIAFTSGKGSSFIYDYEHPLTGDKVIPAQDGLYRPIIQKINLNNKWYGVTGGTNTIPANLNCIDPILVRPCDCGNRTNNTNEKRQFNHLINFKVESGKIPTPISVSIVLSANTKFISWSFRGLERPDRISVFFSGSSYNSLIGLDDYIIGEDLNVVDLGINTFPKSAATGNFYTKPVSLKGLTVNDNDRIIINITPFDPKTSWSLFYTCVNDWDCNECISTSEYKIIKSILTGYTKPTNTTIELVNGLPVSGCTYENYFNSPLNLYFDLNVNTFGPTKAGGIYPSNNNVIYNTLIQQAAQMSWNQVSCGQGPATYNYNCTQYGSPITIAVETLPSGNKVFGFSGGSDFITDYYNDFIDKLQNISGTTTTDNTKLDYYRMLRVTLPNTQTSSCDDSFNVKIVSIHTSSKFAKGVTSGVDWFRITASTVTDGLNASPNQINCNSLSKTYVDILNNDATGTTYTTYYSTLGAVSDILITSTVNVFSSQTINTANTFYGFYTVNDNDMTTIPFSTNTYSLLPQYSGNTCNKYLQGGRQIIQNGTTYRRFYKYAYKLVLTNPNDVEDFDIYADNIINGDPQDTFSNLVLRWSGRTFSNINPNYVI